MKHDISNAIISKSKPDCRCEKRIHQLEDEANRLHNALEELRGRNASLRQALDGAQMQVGIERRIAATDKETNWWFGMGYGVVVGVFAALFALWYGFAGASVTGFVGLMGGALGWHYSRKWGQGCS